MDAHLKNLFSKFDDLFEPGPGLGPGSGTTLTKVDGINPPFIKSLYKAAAALYRTNPWRRLRSGHLFGVKVGKDRDWFLRIQPLQCLQFIGGDGGRTGFHMFRSPEDARKMTGPRETIRVPNIEVLRVTYEMESEILPSHRGMVSELALERSGNDRWPVFDVVRCTQSGVLEFRNPEVEELRAAYAIMKAVSLVHPLLVYDAEGSPKHPLLSKFERFVETVDIQWPAEMIKANDLVAVTISYPLNPGPDEKKSSASSTLAKKSKQLSEEESFCRGGGGGSSNN